MGVDHVGWHTPHVDAGHAEHPANGPLRRRPGAAGAQVPLPHPGHRAQHEVGEDPRVHHAQPVGGQRRVDQHEPGHQLGGRHRGQRSHQSPHRVAHQHDRAVGHPAQEGLEEGDVAFDIGCAPGRRRASVAEEVDRQQVVTGGQVGGDGRPVEVRTPEPVDADQQRAVRRTPVVGVVHGAAGVDGVRGGVHSGHGRHLPRLPAAPVRPAGTDRGQRLSPEGKWSAMRPVAVPWSGSGHRVVIDLSLVLNRTPSIPWTCASPKRDCFHPPNE